MAALKGRPPTKTSPKVGALLRAAKAARDDVAALLDGTGVTACCGALATFHDETLCCKACWREIR
jgi:hypothetical protein